MDVIVDVRQDLQREHQQLDLIRATAEWPTLRPFEPLEIKRPEPLTVNEERRNWLVVLLSKIWNKNPLGKVETPLYAYEWTSRKYGTRFSSIMGHVIFILVIIFTVKKMT